MFDFSLGKLIIVALIALIVLGPDKLPGAARTAGALIRRLRGGWDNVRSEVERELEIEEIRRAARQAAADAEAAQSEASSTLKHLNEELDKVRHVRLDDAVGGGIATDARARDTTGIAASGSDAAADASDDTHTGIESDAKARQEAR